MQLGYVNIGADTVSVMQAGFVNYMKYGRFGFGFLNVAVASSMLQVGFTNVTRDSSNMQIGFANVNGGVGGMQIGSLTTRRTPRDARSVL
jgi:hypothetical protein